MTSGALTVPAVFPAEQTIASFWRRIAYLTTRTRCRGQRWVGSPEAKMWNASNPECLKSRTACDRKIRFLYECTKDEYFPTEEQFIFVYNQRDKTQCRAYKKTANRRRHDTSTLFRKTNDNANIGKWI
ncbi:hypothetical protein C8R47DRAFT_1069168 [Mycena vitilis]|nr:hypothetical protein C8R47DRAFT_1069168 [Mycena vitilis]